jgi:hypothetical protein
MGNYISFSNSLLELKISGYDIRSVDNDKMTYMNLDFTYLQEYYFDDEIKEKCFELLSKNKRY